MKFWNVLTTRQESALQTHVAKLWFKLALSVILIFAISFALRVFRLDFYSLWYDEVSTVSLLHRSTSSSVLTAIINTTGSETLHPLYYLIMAGWIRIAGDSVWALRFPSAFFGSCVVVVYALLLLEVGGKKSFSYAALMVIAPFLVWYSRDARPYALIMFLTGLNMLFYLRLLIKPQSKTYLFGFVITGILSIYSGMFVGMLIVAELAWSIVRRKRREIAAIAVVLLFVLPLGWQGYKTFFQQTSDRYRPLPTGVNIVRIMGFPQEFLVARSLGPTPDEVRQLPLNKVLSEKFPEIGVETLAIVCILVSLVASIRSCRKTSASREYNIRMIQALGFIAVAVCFQAAMLIAITGYQMNARHICFLFGPLFVSVIYPIARSGGCLYKILFITSLLVLWIWSSGNQLFNHSYVPEDFKNVARTIESDEHNASQVIALCHNDALRYYGVKKPLMYFMESPKVTAETLMAHLKDEGRPVWLVLARPWAYPNFHAEDLESHFRILQTKELPGISMWLLLPSD